MMERLFDPGPTDRQYRALVFILGEPEVQIVEVGRMLHEHDACPFCFGEGLLMAKALEAKGLVTIGRGTVKATRRAAERSRTVATDGRYEEAAA